MSGSSVTLLTSGTCTIVASQSGNSTYAAPSVSQTSAVNGTPQTITFSAISTQTVGGSLTPSATASSTLPVSYASLTASVCTVSCSSVTFLALGTCTIAASQNGNSKYAAAPTVTQSFNLTSLIVVTGASFNLAPGNGGTATMAISGLTAAPTTLGLGGISLVNVSNGQYNLGGSNGVINVVIINVTSTSATLVVYVSATVQASTNAYSIPVTIGSTAVGTLTLTVPFTSQTITFPTITTQKVNTP